MKDLRAGDTTERSKSMWILRSVMTYMSGADGKEHGAYWALRVKVLICNHKRGPEERGNNSAKMYNARVLTGDFLEAV